MTTATRDRERHGRKDSMTKRAKKSDEQIRQEVEDELRWESAIGHDAGPDIEPADVRDWIEGYASR
jgi:hypothetical protein